MKIMGCRFWNLSSEFRSQGARPKKSFNTCIPDVIYLQKGGRMLFFFENALNVLPQDVRGWHGLRSRFWIDFFKIDIVSLLGEF